MISPADVGKRYGLHLQVTKCNTDYFFFRPFKGRNFKIMDRKDSVNQDAYLFPILFAGNLTVSSRARHFVIAD